MVIEAGLVAGYVAAWAVRKAKRAGAVLDAETDDVIDTLGDRLHEVVAAKLGGDPALGEMQEEVAAGLNVSDLTRQRVELALLAAAGKDTDFARQVSGLVEQLKAAELAGGRATAIGQNSVAVAGDVSIQARDGSVAAWSLGDVRLGGPGDPP